MAYVIPSQHSALPPPRVMPIIIHEITIIGDPAAESSSPIDIKTNQFSMSQLFHDAADSFSPYWEIAKPYIPGVTALMGAGMMSLGVYNYTSLKADDPKYTLKRNASILQAAVGVATVAMAIVIEQTSPKVL